MANTMTRTATRATGGARRAGRAVAADPAREVARAAMSEAGRRVLGVVVDRAVSRVEGVADRLDDVAEGGIGLREALTGRPAPPRSARKAATGKTGPGVRARVGAAFGLVVLRAVQILQFLQRLALHLLEALRRLARRPRTAPADPAAAGAEQDGPAEGGEPGEQVRAPRGRGLRRPRTGTSGPQPVRSVPAEPVPGRGGARPGSRTERTEGRGRPNRADRGE
ncbi:hypothetical protein [Pseudonocardia acidicola]|uniref:Uncharacterized protein n=1 Tax=Pseudonocardia acidicola TaxID=2724939 RepID=A0ABX1SP56_9PSEU|nr:hypothetical protein [Pseudonocardia acidicola]NMI02212.1 hypothetical protein [Pseudonocardia acidicola]